ncbi:hypothetical protein Desor_5247 [Desulfosporosinus orientis DSM 765]|uniref:DUF5667 domain-containing protein n=1 Tax=Desulfosporosinus orientis (strain ATCC 19365 / DSM 765 / NCIMB 8382 / VKM B-1628 / Singapore I) TaxID=768706 RepID=G7W9R4_DESOD|nr:DUF5667 domain-containing protein [Desulfosporosinus orientis]AET70630.1 hypothetical protein Desor_5247 [Desulfosporosinus orientis DSM 765]
MQRTKSIKKQIAVGITAALLVLPMGISPAFADTATSTGTTTTAAADSSANTTTTDNAANDVASTDTGNTGTGTDVTGTDSTNSDVDSDSNAEDQDNDSVAVVDEDGNTVDPANWLTDLIGKLQIALTFDPVHKSQLMEEHALKKLAKAQKLMAEGKTEESQTVFYEYADKIAKAQEFLDKVEDPSSEEAQKLTLALTNVNQKNVEVLGNLLEKLPPQAAQKVALNVVRSMEKAVTKLEKQDAQVDSTTESDTVPVTVAPATDPATPAADQKELKKQAKAALKEFKKSLQEKGNFHLNDSDDNDQDQDQDNDDTDDTDAAVSAQDPVASSSQPTSVTVAPGTLKSMPSVSGEHDKIERQNQDKNHDEKGKDDNNKQDDHQGKK